MEGAKDLIEEFEGHPLALTIVGKYLKSSCLSIQEVTKILEDCGHNQILTARLAMSTAAPFMYRKLLS